MVDSLVIEPGKFAREQAIASGSFAPEELVRLKEHLLDGAGAVEYRIGGFITSRGQPALRIELRGELGLRCQRCLERLAFALALRRDVVLVAGMDEFRQRPEEDETVDAIPAVKRIDLRELVEEEVLLALPMAPRHQGGECIVQQGEAAFSSHSALAALAKLKH